MKIVAFPKDANPYQELLYGAMRRQQVTVSYLEGPTGSHTVNLLLLPAMLTRKRLQGYKVLHVHWTFPFRLPFGGILSRTLMELWAAGFWLLAKACGMRLVWTAHNALPHEPLFLNDRRAHRFLGRRANLVLVHTTAARQQLLDIGVPADHLHIVPHGSYIGAYPDSATAKTAKQTLQLPPASRVLLFFGLIRPYKGIEQLLASFQTLPATEPLILLIAGSVSDAALRETLEQAAAADDRIRLQLRYIANDELQLFFRAADFTVLPYERSTTSGVSLLACSFACPIVAPRQAAFADIPAEAQISYDTGQLAQALRKAATIQPAALGAKSRAAYAYAQTLSWETIAAQTITYIQDAS